ncbi:MFS transporter [Xylanibacillus composti]|uniref:MFS transporter n=1 Tax=Xylanibacillus composti TaxID=1572762 RepID=A0A8J4H4R9_9BACL|nr:MDR family MFS transporter [Xylanibacillus composti]MDT9727115.1 MFS transporter [Xylanibacillus composti]GIQ68874.1 MFS transporter [Xylanibacillus composti]
MNTPKVSFGVLSALMVAMLLAALDQTIVATAMPQIVTEMGEMTYYSWIFSIYMIAELVAMPIFGKLSDLFGRKRMFLTGLIVFIVGSALCGYAQSLAGLVLFRGIQGIGAGAIMPVAFAIVFDIFPVDKRARMQAFLATVFGIASVFGPIIGAVLTEYLHWRWIFYMNLPLGLLSVLLLIRFYTEKRGQHSPSLDWQGLLLLFGALAALLLVFEWAGSSFGWHSPATAGILLAFLVLFASFIWVERRATEPFIPLHLFGGRRFSVSQVVGLLQGAVMMVTIMYIPLYMQLVSGNGVSGSGYMLMPMMLGLVVCSVVGGRVVEKISYRQALLIAGAHIVLGTVLLGSVQAHSSNWLTICSLILVGGGLGLSFPVLFTTSLHGAEQEHRGTINALVPFFRSIGGVIGVSVFGSIQMQRFAHRAAEEGKVSPSQLQAVHEWLQRGGGTDPSVQNLASYLADSIIWVFQASAVTAVLSLLAGLWIGRERLVLPPSEAAAYAPKSGSRRHAGKA